MTRGWDERRGEQQLRCAGDAAGGRPPFDGSALLDGMIVLHVDEQLAEPGD